MKRSEISFLIGSGVSCAAGLKSVKEITDAILSGNGTNYGSYNYVFRSKNFLEIVSNKIEEGNWFEMGRKPNYEELYYAVEQLYEYNGRELENPLIHDAFLQIKAEAECLLNRVSGDRVNWDFSMLLRETIKYIKKVVWDILDDTGHDNSRHGFLLDAIASGSQNKYNIFTTNHDLLIEDTFFCHGINYTDGYSKPIDGLHRWCISEFECETKSVRLLKLHGSIDWFETGQDDNSYPAFKIQKGLSIDQRNDIMYRSKDFRPTLLIGTFNKMIKYSSGIFADLICLLWQYLRRSKTLIVCGYGFGDKGINNHIFNWMSGEKNTQLIVIHHSPDKLKKNARGAFRKLVKRLTSVNRLQFISKRAENVSWQDIKERL